MEAGPKDQGKQEEEGLQGFVRDSHADTMTPFPEPFSDTHGLYRD